MIRLALALALLLPLPALAQEPFPCMPYTMWVQTVAPLFHVELVDVSMLGNTEMRVEYWASADRVNSAIVVVKDGGACPVRTVDLSKNLGAGI